MVNLYLIDLDGTLIASEAVQAMVFKESFKKIFKNNPPMEVLKDCSGKTLYQCIKCLCKNLNIECDESFIQKIEKIREKIILNILKKEKPPILPGVIKFLEELKSRNIPFSMITGNSEVTGTALIEKTGLMSYFPVQIFAEGRDGREDLIKKAILVVKERGYHIDNIIVIGDSIEDVEAGNEMGGFTIGVATGLYSKEELKSAGADLTMETLEEYETIFQAVE